MAKLEVLPKRVDVLEVNSPESVFRINIDILNEAFGVGRGMYAKAVYPDKMFIAKVKYRKLQPPFVGNCRINGWGKCRF